MRKKIPLKDKAIILDDEALEALNPKERKRVLDRVGIVLLPDWEMRWRSLQYIASLESPANKRRMRDIFRSMGFTPKKIARALAIAYNNRPYRIIRNEAARKRWKILERDNFTCQYCGRKAPEVKLEVDHKAPVTKGGRSIDDNLITACVMCNQGKGVDVTNKNYTR